MSPTFTAVSENRERNQTLRPYSQVEMAKHDFGTGTRRVWKTVDSPVGQLTLVATDVGLAAVLWENDRPRLARLQAGAQANTQPLLVDVERQLQEYFSGARRHFTVPLDFAGTEFQCRVWNALLTIPFGETRSYGQIAEQVGSPSAVRAVGAANGRNPVSIIAPCHRVIGSTGKLTGFAGGLDAKAFLLTLEGVNTDMFADGVVAGQSAASAAEA